MLREDKTLKLIEIFITCDDFCNALTRWQAKQGCLPTTRKGEMSDSEMMTLVVFYHHSGYKCFEYYYRNCVQVHLSSHFPNRLTYERFVARMPRLLPGLFVLLKWLCGQSERTGFYIIDSKPLAVCDNHRIGSNKVFDGLAAQGKSSMGWFYGLKLHLVINGTGHPAVRPVSQLRPHAGQRFGQQRRAVDPTAGGAKGPVLWRPWLPDQAIRRILPAGSAYDHQSAPQDEEYPDASV
jgi:hypothetical protein